MLPKLLPLSIGVFVVVAIALFLFLRYYAMARPGSSALIVRRAGEDPRVILDGGVLLPFVEKVETVHLHAVVSRLGFNHGDELSFADGPREADVDVDFAVKPDEASVLEVARTFGCELDPKLQLSLSVYKALRAAIAEHAATIRAEEANGRPSQALALAIERALPGHRVTSASISARSART